MVENRSSEETPRGASFKETPLYKLLNGLDNWLATPLDAGTFKFLRACEEAADPNKQSVERPSQLFPCYQ